MNHVVTGATGFVGSSLALELLLRTDQMVVGVTRPSKDHSATQRLHNTLIPLVEAYGLPGQLIEVIKKRVVGVAGDLELPLCGVGNPRSEMIESEFWHCAASLRYQDRHQESIDRTNIDGTGNAIKLAKSIKAHRFNMVSTAYVAGSRRGMLEAEVADVSLVNNLYERSKIFAEKNVTEQEIPYRILRPSIVIGHSSTHHTISADGLYGLFRTLRKFKAMLDYTQNGLANKLDIRLLAEPDAKLDLVPVDHVAGDAVSLSLADAPVGHYHLTNPASPTVGEVADVIFELVGLRRPIFVDEVKHFSVIDAKLYERVDFYKSYVVNSKVFGRSSVDDVLGAKANKGCLLGVQELTSLVNCYLGQTSRVQTKIEAVQWPPS